MSAVRLLAVWRNPEAGLTTRGRFALGRVDQLCAAIPEAVGCPSILVPAIRKKATHREADVSFGVGDHHVLSGTVPISDDVERLVHVRGILEFEDVEVDEFRMQRRPLHHRVTRRPGGVLIGAVDQPPASGPDRIGDGIATGDFDHLDHLAEGFPSFGGAIAIGIVRVDFEGDEILEITGEVGEPPGDVAVASDRDAGKARDREPGQIVFGPEQTNPVPGHGQRESEVGIVGENRAAVRGQVGADRPLIGPDGVPGVIGRGLGAHRCR